MSLTRGVLYSMLVNKEYRYMRCNIPSNESCEPDIVAFLERLYFKSILLHIIALDIAIHFAP